MFLLRRIPRSSLNKSYCRVCARLFSQRHLNLQKTENNSSEALLKEYEERLLYNSVIDSQKRKLGYAKNAEILMKRRRFKDHMVTALRTIQPLPLTLKYALDPSDNTLADEPSNQQTILEPSTEHSNTLTQFPYNVNSKIDEVSDSQQTKTEPLSIKNEIAEKKKLLDESKENWMTHYENYEQDLLSVNDNEASLGEPDTDWKINYGTPDPNCPISKQPCGGCGAHLHCKDTAIPGYIPAEIFKNSTRPGGASLQAILCQRCHFLKEYNVALQVRVSPDDYPKVLQSISFKSALAVLMVDLTDFPCSIWPGIADILGSKSPILVVGNKVDLLPRDDPKYLRRVKEVLLDNLKLSGFASANVKHIQLISAKTGYGVEDLITSLQRVWRQKGDVYLIGCTNVGKSSLFNQLLQSDYCKVQAADLIQRATTSPWPGTTLNLLKFPVTRFTGHRLYVRQKRLENLRKLEAEQRKLSKETLGAQNTPKNATLMGHIERSLFHKATTPDEEVDAFATQGNTNMSGKTRLGINETSAEFAFGKWCYDTPGVVHPDQILHLLTTDELVKTLPKELIRPETFCIKPGTSVFIAGLARLDYVQGPNSVRLTVFRSNSLPITICETDEADSTYKELLGSDCFAVPILKGNRAQDWPGLELAKTFKVFGKNLKESSYDVVLSSAGWIGINCGLADYEFSAWTPEKRGVYLRDSLLPKAVQLRGPRIRDSVAYKRHKFI